jgi:hypothetical protein
MAPKQWSEGTSRHKWLHERGPQYQAALHAKTKTGFLEKLYHDWFDTYHWSLSNSTEPDPNMVFIEPIDEAKILEKNQIIVAKKEVRRVPPTKFFCLTYLVHIVSCTLVLQTIRRLNSGKSPHNLNTQSIPSRKRCGCTQAR